ncbi:MAG: hypothetical protein ACKPE6_11630 [Gammaproteobacteria bacterium]
MKLDIATRLPCTLEQAVSAVMTPRLLEYVAAPLLRFSPVDGGRFPPVWAEGSHRVRLRLFGRLPFGEQAIVISFPPCAEGVAIHDAGHSALIPVWDHLITLVPVESGVRYRDQLEVKAGLLTPFIWLFAQVFYRHRQRRWRRLVAAGFDYTRVGHPER